jgi:hypothetical protein
MSSKQEYYENKILYALSKIQYSLSRLGVKSKSQKNPLSTLYKVLSDRESVDMLSLMKATKLSKSEVALYLHKLKELGLADWGVSRLNVKSVVASLNPSKKPDFKEWYEDLMKKMQLEEKDEVEGVGSGKAFYSKKELSCLNISAPEFVEIELDSGMILKVTKQRLKKLVLEGLKV